MVCPQCKYVVGEFETHCPKCKVEAVDGMPDENDSEIARAIGEIVVVDDDPIPGQTVPTLVLNGDEVMPIEVSQVTEEETAQPTSLKSGTFTIDESNTLPPDFGIPENEVTFMRSAPSGYGLLVAGIVLFLVALAGFLAILFL